MTKRKHIKAPKYIEKIAEAYQEQPNLFKPGTVAIVEVSHDDWCEIFKGKPCNCNPDIVHVVKP